MIACTRLTPCPELCCSAPGLPAPHCSRRRPLRCPGCFERELAACSGPSGSVRACLQQYLLRIPAALEAVNSLRSCSEAAEAAKFFPAFSCRRCGRHAACLCRNRLSLKPRLLRFLASTSSLPPPVRVNILFSVCFSFHAQLSSLPPDPPCCRLPSTICLLSSPPSTACSAVPLRRLLCPRLFLFSPSCPPFSRRYLYCLLLAPPSLSS